MRYATGLFVAVLFVVAAAAQAEARPSRKGRRRIPRRVPPKSSTSSSSKATDPEFWRASDGEKAIEWMTDFDEAAARAAKEKRGMMVLFTTEQLMQDSRSCRFDANSARRAVRSAKVVPVRLLPPVRGDRKGLSQEEIAAREKAFQKALKRYAELVKQFAVSKGPSLIFTATDAVKLDALVVPERDRIEAKLGRMSDMIAAYEKRLAEKNAGAKPAAAPKVVKAGKPAAKPAQKDKPGGAVAAKPAAKPEAADPDDDF